MRQGEGYYCHGCTGDPNRKDKETTDQKLDRIIELLEERTNPPNLAWPYPPTYPGCGCNHEARELIFPNLNESSHTLEEWTKINDNRD